MLRRGLGFGSGRRQLLPCLGELAIKISTSLLRLLVDMEIALQFLLHMGQMVRRALATGPCGSQVLACSR